jgi:hypothetical protein
MQQNNESNVSVGSSTNVHMWNPTCYLSRYPTQLTTLHCVNTALKIYLPITVLTVQRLQFIQVFVQFIKSISRPNFVSQTFL